MALRRRIFADGSRPGALAAGLVTLAFLTLFPCAGYAQSNLDSVQLEFTTPSGASLQVPAGGTVEVEIALVNPGSLESGETVLVTLTAEGVGVSTDTVVLSMTASSATLTIDATGVAAGTAGSVTAMGAVLSGGSVVGNKSVGTATLTVSVVREFVLRFETLSGEALSSVGVVAGATTEVAVVLTDAEALEPGESVSVTLTAIVQQLTLTEATPRITLSIGAAVDAVVGETVEATGVVLLNGAVVAHTRVRLATLSVVVLPRRFALRFETPEGTVLETAWVTAGSTTEVTVVLTDTEALEPGEAIPVMLTTETVSVVPPVVALSAAASSAVLTIGATVNAMFGTLTADADTAGVINAVVQPATLAVEIVPRRFVLRFETPEGTVLETAQVVAGRTTEVAVVLENADSLEPGETVPVTLTEEGVDVSTAAVVLSLTASSAMLTIDATGVAAGIAGSVTAMGEVLSGGSAMENTSVGPATLAVEVVPRRFVLRFETPAGAVLETARVTAGRTTEVAVVLENADSLEFGETVPVTLTEEGVGVSTDTVVLSMTASRARLTIGATGVATGVTGSVTATGAVLSGGFAVENTLVVPATLAVEVVPRRFVLRFETPEGTVLETAQVVAGSTAEVAVVLENTDSLESGEAVLVALTAEGVDVSADTVVLSMTASRAPLTIDATGVAAGTAGSVTATGAVLSGGFAVENTLVVPATLAVEVVREFVLRFETLSGEALSSVGVVAGATIEVAVALTDAEALEPGESVSMTLTAIAQQLTLTEATPRITLSIGAAVDAVIGETVEATGVVLLNGAVVAYTRVRPAVLSVVVLPRRFALRFETPEGTVLETAEVVAGSTTEVAVVLENAGALESGEAIPVTLTTETVSVVPPAVTLTAAAPGAVLTIGATVNVMSGALTADADTAGVINAVVQPATLGVEVLLRRFALRFETPEGTVLETAQVVAGSTTEVAVVLENADLLESGEEISVTLTVEGVDVSMDTVVLSMTVSSARLTIDATANAMPGTLTAKADTAGLINAVAQPATLSVVVLPRRFALRFETPEGTVLETARVTAGSTTEVAVALTNAEALESGEAISVTLTAEGVDVSMDTVVLSMTVPRVALRIAAAMNATSGRLTAEADTAGVMNAVVQSATLAVEVLPRRFALRFETPEGAALETVQVVAGSTTEVAVALANAEALEPGESVPMMLTAIVQQLTLTEATPRITLSIGVAVDTTIGETVEATGVVLLNGAMVVQTRVRPATLSVEISPRRFALRFETPEGTALETARVTAGRTTEVVVALTDAEALEFGETVPVTLTTETVSVVPPVVTLTAAASSAMLTIGATANAMPGTLTAEADATGLTNVAVQPATLAVEILPRRFGLRFETPEGAVLETARVAAERTTEVTVVLTDAEALESDETVPVMLTSEGVGVVPPVVMLTEATPRATLLIAAAANATSGTLTAEADTADVTNAAVQPGMLAVTVTPVPVDLQLAFEPPALAVAVGGERTVVLRLLGDVPAGATVTVALSTAAMATAQVVQESVVFTVTTQSHAVTVLGVVEGSVMLTAVFADDLADSGLPPESTVASADLAVTVVPAVTDPVMLQLAFEPTSLTVVTGSTATAMLRLPGDVPEGIEVRVDLSAADEATARVLSSSVILSAETTSREVAVLGVAAGSVTITAAVSEAVLTGSLPAGSSVAPVDLAVTVVLPTVDLQLAFEPQTLTVATGSTATAVLRLPGVPAAGGAAVTVALSVADEATAQVMPAEVIFSEANPDTVVTLTGTTTGDVMVTAVAVLLDGLSEASTVRSAQLPVTVVREFIPRFETLSGEALSSVEVVAGATTEVAVVVENTDLLAPEEAVLVILTMETVSVVPRLMLLTEATPRITLSIGAAVDAVAEGTVRADGVVFLNGSMVAYTRVRPVTLAVRILPRRFALRFETPEGAVLETARVTAGRTTEVVVALTNAEALEPGESVSMMLTAIIQQLTLTEATPRITLSIGAAVDAVAGETVEATGVVLLNGAMVMRTQVRPATLAVEVLPRRFALRFETPEGAVLERAQVVAGSTTEVAVALTNAEALEFDEAISVTLTTEGVDVSTDTVVLSMTVPGAVLTIGAAVNAMPGTLTAEADAAGLTNVAVQPATLAVEILPRRFGLRFETPEGAVLETARVAAERTTEVTVVLTDAEALESDETVPVMLTSEGVGVVPPVVMLTEATPRATLLIAAAANATSGTLTAEADTADVTNAAVQPGMLAVTVTPVPVDLQLAFEPPALAVAVGGERTVVLRLLGDVPSGATVTVALSTAAMATAQVVQESVVFTVTTQSHAVTVLGVVEGSVMLTAVFADDLADSGLPPESTVASADLAVTVVPVVTDPVMLQLAFEPTSLTVVTGSTATAMLRLPGDVPEGIEVRVDLNAADETTARVLSPSMIFSAETTSREVTVLGEAAGSVTITAAVSEAVLTGSLPAGSSVAPVDLAVTVVLPTVDLQLAFEPPTLTVATGSTATAMLRLPGVPAVGGAAVTVALSVADEATAQVMPAEVIFSEANPDTVVTLTGTTTGDVMVTAVAVLLDGLSEASTVRSAQLPVTVVREFIPRFETLSGEVLSSVEVVAGATTEVAIVVENTDLLAPEEAVLVILTRETVSVVPRLMLLTEATPRITLSIGAAVDAVAEGTVRAGGVVFLNGSMVAYTRVRPVTLAVRILPRRFALRFETPEGAVLETARVTAGRTTEVVVALTNAEALEPGETVPVTLTAEGVDMSTDAVVLSMTASRVPLTIDATGVAAGIAGSVTATGVVLSDGSAVESVSVGPATLAVEVVPRRFALRFETPAGTVLETARVTAGRTTEVAIVLGNADLLEFGETVSVTLTAEGVDVSTDTVVLSMTASSAMLTIDATVNAMSGTLTAEADATGLMNVAVQPGTLAVEVLPRRFGLRFETLSGEVLSSVEVVAGATTEVTIALANADLLVSGEAIPVMLTAEGVGVVPPVVTLTEATSRAALRIVAAANAMSGILTAEADTADVMNVAVQPGMLAVTVTPAPVDLQLVFEPPTLTVAVGGERTAVLRLPGDVPAGAAVTVALSTAATATAQVVQESVVFTATTQSHAITIRGVAEGSATLTAAFADDLADSGLPAESTVASADLVVTVVPAVPVPVMLQLAFEPTSLTVAVGSEATAVLRLLGDVPEGVEVRVELSSPDATTARVLSPSVILSAETTSREVAVLGVAAGSVTITAAVSEAVLTDSLPSGSSVASADLAVTVVPAPVMLRLAFEPPTLTVVTGSTATAVLRLLGDVPEGAAVTVALSVADEETAGVTPAEVIFSEANPDTVVTLTGTTAGDATVTAVAALLDGLPEASTVRSAQLPVTVVREREFALGFETPEGAVLETARVTAGRTTEVAVVLTGTEALALGETVSVTLTAEGMDVGVGPPVVTLTEATPRITLSIGAAVDAVVGGTVEAMGVVLLDGVMVAYTRVRPATLAVEVLPRRFALRFETPEGTVLETARVTAGSTTEVTIALENADLLVSGEAVLVRLTAEGVDASTAAMALSMTAPGAVLTIAAATTAMSGTLTAEADTAGLMNAVVQPATLAVEILPRRFALRFETPEGAVLETARVTAGSTTEVAVALENADLLESGEAVPVTLTVEGVDVSTDTVVLSMTAPDAVLTIAAATTAMSGTLTAEADVAGLMNAAVQPATLAVEILPRRFALRFETPEGAVLEMAEVAAGSAMSAVEVAVALENADSLEPGETVSVMLTAAGVGVSTDVAVLSMTASRAPLTIDATGVAAGIAGSVTATGVVLSGGSVVENTSVDPATLTVLVVREFALRFEMLSGEALSSVEVVAGATTEIAIALENADLLEPGEAVSVSVTLTAVIQQLTLTEATPRITLSIGAAADAVVGETVEAMGVALLDGAMVAYTRVRMATLSIEVLPRRFGLRFETPEGTVLETARVTAGRAIEVTVALTGVEALEPDETVSVTLTAKGVDVGTDTVELSMTVPRAVLTINAATTATSGMLTAEADAAGLTNAVVEPATLAVEVVPRRFALRFETPAGAALETARVVAGSTTEVAVVLTGAEALEPGETMPVTLTAEALSVVPPMVTLTEATPRAALRIDATVNAMSGTLMAEADAAGLTNVVVEPATLAVEVLPRRFALRFETPEGAVLETARVVAGSTTEVAVVLTGAGALESGETVPVTLTAETLSVVPPMVTLTEATPRAVLRIAATANAMSGTLTAQANTAGVMNVVVEPATLAVEILPRRFALRFETPEGTVLETARVTAGSTTEATVALENADLLESGEAVSVTLMAEGVDVSTNAVVLSMTAPGAVLTINAAANATSGTLTAQANTAGVMNAVVEPATLAVEVLPRRFALRFETPEGAVLETARVTARSTTEVAVALTGAGVLEPGEAVPVMLTAEGVDVSTDTVVLSMTTPGAVLTIAAAANATSGMLTAQANTAGVMNVVVEPATLSVEVLPRRFGLRFETPEGTVLETAQVTAGSTTEVAVALTGAGALEPGEAVPVMLTAEGVDVSTNAVVLSMATPGAVLAIAAAVNATSGTLTAQANTAGVMNAVVEPATLAVEILPRRFALRFETPEGTALETARVTAGSTTEVAVVLENADLLEPGEAVPVTLTAEGVDVSTAAVVLSMTASSAVLTIGAAANAMSGTLTAQANTAGVMNAVVEPATLAVEILPRRFGLRFETPEGTVLETARVTAGSTTEVAVALTGAGALESGETVPVTLTAEGVDASTAAVVLSMTAPGAVLTIGAAANATSGTLTAQANTAGVMNVVVEPATLAVEVLPRRFALRFETPEGTVLETARVTAGSTTEVTVALENAEALESGETVSVTLTAEGVDVGVVPPAVTLTEATPRATLRIAAATDVESLSGTVAAVGEVVSGDAVVARTNVGMASLPVEVVVRRFRLSVSGLSGAAFSRVVSPAALILSQFGMVRNTISVEEDITVESLVVTVSISHEFISHLRITLISPEGTEVVLHDRTGDDTDDVRQVYTSAGNAGLASLAGESARGEWVLAMSDDEMYWHGTLESWGLYVNPSPGGDLRVVAGSAAPVAMVELTGVATPFGESRLAPGERLTVGFGYDGTGVDVAPVTLVLVASSSVTVAGLVAAAGLTASVDARSGALRAEGSGLANAVVEAVPSSVTVVDRQFHLSLLNLSGAAFAREETPAVGIPDGVPEQSVRSTISVEEDITIESLAVTVSITHSFLSNLWVTLIPPGGQETVLHRGGLIGVADLRQVYTMENNGGLASLARENARGDWVLTVGDYFFSNDEGRLESWGLYVNPSSTVVRVVAGGSATVLVELAGVETPFGRARLSPRETLGVDFEYEGQGVTVSSAELSGVMPLIAVPLTAAANATSGTLTAQADTAGVTNAVVRPATLAVEVLPPAREFVLSFATPSGDVLETARVVAGSTTEVAVVLENPRLLEPGESVRVTLTAETVSVAPSVVTLTEATPRAALRVAAATDVESLSGTVAAAGEVVSGDAVVAHTGVGMASLPVEVVVRRFRLSVSGLSRAAFSRVVSPAALILSQFGMVRNTISVEEDITVESLAVTVSISHEFISHLRITLISPEGTEVVLHDRTGDDTDDVRQVYTSAGNAGLASLTGERARGEWVLAMSDDEMYWHGTLESWGLYVNPSPGGDLRVVAGSAAPVAMVELTGVATPFGESRLAPGERLTVGFGYDGTGVDVAPVTLEASSSVTVAGLVAAAGLTASVDARSGVLRAEGSGLANAVVEAVPSSVTVVDRQFHLSLLNLSGAAFAREETPAVDIPDGVREQSVRRTISMEEDIAIESLAVTVSITHPALGHLWVTLIPPGGQETVLHRGGLVEVADLRQVYTLENNGGLASLAGENARGDWILTVGDYFFGGAGRLESWGLYVNPSSTVARVVTGGSATVLVELAGVETPFGRARLSPRETLGVGFEYEGQGVTVPSAELSGVMPLITVPLTVATNAMSGMLTAEADTAGVTNAVVQPATLAVEVVPRRFALRFETPAGAALGTVRVTAGSTTEVTVSLTNAEALEPGETVPVTLTAEGVGVSTDTVVLSMTASRVALTIDATGVAAGIAGSVTATGVVLSDGSAVESMSVGPATLAVEVVPRRFALRFETPAGTVLETAQVTARSTTEVAVALTNAEALEPGETVSVTLTAEGVGVSTDAVVLSMTASRVALTIDATGVAAGIAGSVTATGVVLSDGSAVESMSVGPATLAVEVVPRRFALRFETPAGTVLETAQVTARSTTEVTVALTNAEALEPGETVSVTLTAEGVGVSTDAVVLSMTAPRVALTIDATGVAAGIAGSVTATGVVLSDGSAVESTSVGPATLAVEVVPRRFALRFETPAGTVLETARVTAGSTTEVTVALTNAGALESGETVSVTLTAEGVGVSTDAVVLSMTAPRVALTIDATGVAAGIAGSVTATGVVLSDGSAVESTSVGPATLAVEVFSRRFALRFETPAGTVLETARVTARSTTEVTVALTNAEALEPGETVSVTLTAEGVGVSTDAVVLSMTAPRVVLTIDATGVAAGIAGSVTATGVVLSDGSVVESTSVGPATLAVEVFSRRFALQFETSEGIALETARVVAGRTTEVAVALTNAEALESGETVSVTLTAEGVGVSTDTVVLSMTASSAVLTIGAAANATSGTLTAQANTAGVMNVVVEPATLAVEILPRRFALRFETPEGTVLETARVTAGSTVEVAVALENADLLEPGEAVPVMLTAEGVGVSTDTVVLSMTASSAVLTIGAATTSTSGTLTAKADVAGVMNAVVEPATLAVEVLPRRFALRFETPAGAALGTVRVTAGSTTEVTVALENADLLEPGEAVPVMLTAEGVGVSTDTVVLSMTASSAVLTIGAATTSTSGTLTAKADVAGVMNAVVEPATLAVEVVPRRFALRFETPEGTVLERAQVVEGSTVEVAVALENADLLEPGEAVPVTLTAEGVDVSTDAVVLSMTASSAVLTIGAATTSTSGTLTAAVADDSDLPEGSTVAPVRLLVTVVESPGLRLRVRVLLEGPLQ